MNENQQTLMQLLFQAHDRAARDNDNGSKTAFVLAYRGSGSVRNGIIAALASTGDNHAPLDKARDLWDGLDTPDDYYERNKKIPGFGNSFYKDKIDPAFVPVVERIKVDYPEQAKKLQDLRDDVRALTGKKLHPNAAIITACVASICKLPKGSEFIMFTTARSTAWLEAAIASTG